MALQAGARLGPYEILSLIGAGGMGEVYRARDPNLHRDIAIKVLPERVARDPERIARFAREAQTLAALNHPNIAHVHGVEESGGVRALLMELVEGEDLAQRLKRGPLMLDEVLPIARQIAEALEAAHEHGIIHRDLKPANIKIRDDGTVKVLDFGLAKALTGDVGGQTPAAEALAHSPTVTSPAMMTEAGVILGTAAYMAPEQARGKPADKRSDIWAFGCVLYEMLSGARAFDGEDVSDTMANVLKSEPDWDRLPDATPPAVRLLLRRCLRKDRRHRLQDAAGVRIEIEEALASAPDAGPRLASPKKGRAALWRLAWVAGLALGGAAVAGLAVWNLKPSPPSPPQRVARFAMPVPIDEELILTYPSLAVSPDGARLVYVARRRGVQQLHLRSIDSLDSKALSGTEGAFVPFFSPDGQWIGFFAEGKLKRISVTGGASQIVCDAPDTYGGSWAPNDIIYFAPGTFSGVWQVSATGGAPQPFTKLQGAEISHRWPQVLPDGQAVLFTSWKGPGSDEQQVQVQRVSGERRVLAQGDTGYYIPTGHLVYVQGATGTLVAVAFDPSQLRVGAAAPVAVAQGIRASDGEGPHYAVSGGGLLAYLAGLGRANLDRTLVWVDRRGNADPLHIPSRPYELARVSPDGEHVAFMTSGARKDIWVYDPARANATRFISEGSNQYPVWTPDGKRLTYRGTRAGTRNIFWRMADGSGTEERLTMGPGNHEANSWSPDGQVLLFTAEGAVQIAGPDVTGGGDILALRLSDRKTQPFVQTRFWESAARFSPDGRWVAYLSEESGREEIYVRAYPGPSRNWQISTDGGAEPVWNPNGRELFYRRGNKMMAVNITTRPSFAAGQPVLLFTGDYVLSPETPNYDVSPDGRRFLMVQADPRENARPTEIIVVLNWFDELKRLVPTK